MLLCPVTLTWMDSQSGSLSKCQLSIASTTSGNTAMEAFARTPGVLQRLTDNFLFNSGEKRLTQSGLNLGELLPTVGQRTISTSGPGTLTSCIPPRACFPSLSISSGFHPEAYWFLMFSISLSKGLISILQHHFQDNFSDQFSRHVLPFLRGVTHSWWQWIDYKETWGECSAFWRLARIWWGLGSSPRKHQLLSFPFVPQCKEWKRWAHLTELSSQPWTWMTHYCEQYLTESLHPSFATVINYPGGCFGFNKERPLFWEAPQS